MSLPLISVVTPVYNPDESIHKTIQSVLNQSYKNLELIIVDDGSEVDVFSVVNQFKDSRIRYYKLEHKNANVARNHGISISHGKYVAMLDADDLWFENHLEDCLNILQENHADGLYGSLLLRDKNGLERPSYVRELNKDEKMINYLLQNGYGAQTSTLFLTSESARDVLWDPALNRHQDYDFVVRYSKRYRLTQKKEPSVIYVYNTKEKVIDFKSCMHFIKINMKDIEPPLYNDYNFHMFLMAKKRKETDDILKYYIKEATRYKEYLSYEKFLTIKYPESWLEKIKYKLEYLAYILQVKVE